MLRGLPCFRMTSCIKGIALDAHARAGLANRSAANNSIRNGSNCESTAPICFRYKTIFPMRERCTPSLAKTRLYSAMISSVTSQTNVSPSIQSLSSLALGLLGGISEEFSPAIPATRTDVSTTPLGRFLRGTGNDGNLRLFLPPHSASANGS